MAVRYANVPLPCSTVKLALWVEMTISTQQVYEFERITHPGKARQHWTFRGTLPTRPVKIGSLYWPQGATRWTTAHFVVDLASLVAITNALGSTPVAAPLVLTQEDQSGNVRDTVTTNLWMLPPRPLQGIPVDANQPGQPFYLITLVDDRFWWQYAHTQDLAIPPGYLSIRPDVAGVTTWSGLYTYLAGQLGIGPLFTFDGIATAYLTPSHTFQSRYQLAAMALDAVAYNVGHRIVRNLDGTVKAMTAATATGIEAANLAVVRPAIAGGQIVVSGLPSRQIPSSVTVGFVRAGVSTDELWPETTATGVLGGGVKVFHDAARANFLGQPGASPSNETELKAMAQQVTTDWVAWQAGTDDLKLVGACNWTPSGYDDSIEWIAREREQSTRVQRTTWNDLAEELLHESTCTLPLGDDFPAQVLGGSNPYSWREMKPQTGGGWAALQNGRSGTAASGSGSSGSGGSNVNPAWEFNGRTNVPSNTIVRMWYGYYLSPDTQDYVFTYSGPGTCSPVYYYETDVRCESGSLNIYYREISLALDAKAGCLTLHESDWYFDRAEGCCVCPSTTSSSSSGSGGVCVPGTCSLCVDPPYQWVVNPSGFTGQCDVFNRQWVLTQNGNCVWQASLLLFGGTVLAKVTLSLGLSISGGGNAVTITFELDNGLTGQTNVVATYTGTLDGNNCCVIVQTSLVPGSCGCGNVTTGYQCPNCDAINGGTPSSWSAHLAGGTNCYAVLNGDFVMDNQVSACTWKSATNANGTYAIFTKGAIGNTDALTVVNANGTQVAYLTASVSTNCCVSRNLQAGATSCNGLPGNLPGSGLNNVVEVVPSCTNQSQPGTCPATLLAVPYCCSGVGSGSGSGSSGSGGGGGGVVTSPCCPGVSLPSVLHVTFTGVSGDCSCLQGQPSYVLTYDPNANYGGYVGAWVSAQYQFLCAAPFTIAVYCDLAGHWKLRISGCGDFAADASPACNPNGTIATWTGKQCANPPGLPCSGLFTATLTK